MRARSWQTWGNYWNTFTGVALALECGIHDAVCHIIAAHAAEGDLVKRTTEAFIVHHADFMAFLPFKNPKNVRLKHDEGVKLER